MSAEGCQSQVGLGADWYSGTGRCSRSPWEVARATGKPVVDRTAMTDMLCFPLLPADPERSLLVGVRRHSRHWQSSIQVWHDHGLPKPHSLANWLSLLDRALVAAVGAALEGADRPAVLTTGGLDSSLVAAIVKEVTGEPPVLISIGAGLVGPTERVLQEHLRDWLGATQARLEELPPFDLASLRRLNAGADFPTGGVFSHVWDAAASLAIEAGADVLLTGEGADDLFSTGGATPWAHLREGRIRAGLAILGQSRTSFDDSPARTLARNIRHAGLPTLLRPEIPPVAHRWRARSPEEADQAAYRRRQQIRRLRQLGIPALAGQSATWLERLDLVGPADSTGSIRVASPIADQRVWAIASKGRISHERPDAPSWQEKQPLRLLARSRLPAAITEQRKVGVPNQIATLLHNADVHRHRESLEDSANWLGINLDDHYFDPGSLAAETGLDWSRLLAMCIWAENAR